MPAYNFQKQFVAAVGSGEKRQTIRKVRKGKGQNAYKGCKLFLYAGQRTKKARLMRLAECQETQAVIIDYDCVVVNGKLLTDHEETILAISDGFMDMNEMTEWFQKHHGLPFEGLLIKW